MKKEYNMGITTYTLDTLPQLPTTFTTSKLYISTISDDSLKGCSGKTWKVHLFECLDTKTGEYDINKLNSKINLLVMIDQRPPKTSGGSKGTDHYNDKMKDTKNKVDTIITQMGIQTGKNGKLYGGHYMMREYIKTKEGKFVMKTTQDARDKKDKK